MSLLQMSFSGAVMIVAVIVIRALAINTFPKRTFLVLWGVALLRLLIPYRLPSVFSVYSLTDKLASGSEGAAALPAEYFAAEPVQGAVNTAAAGGYVSPWPLIWLAGAAVLLVFFVAAYMKCFSEFKTSLPVDVNLGEDWRCSDRLRRPVEIRQSDKIPIPLTYGIFHPVILMPRDFPWADRDTVKYVLAHEYTHIRRFDALAKLVLAAALCVHWFNPLVWAMYFLANRDIELSCDEAVVRLFGEKNRAAYARMLVNMRGPRSSLNPLYSGFNKSAIEERIVAIMKIRKKTVLSLILAIAVVAGTTVAFATSAKEDTPMTPLAEDTTISAPADRDNNATPPETDKNTDSSQTLVDLKENGQTKPAEELAASGSAPAPDTGKQPEPPQPSEKPEPVDPDDPDNLMQYLPAGTVNKNPNDPNAPTAVQVLKEAMDKYLVDGQYRTNAAGQTYGSSGLEAVVGYEPDLLAVQATNGEKGFVDNALLREKTGLNVKNPEEAMEYMKNLPASQTFPVYDLDGNVIGEFIVQGS